MTSYEMMMLSIISLMLVCEVMGDNFSGEDNFSGNNPIDSEDEDIVPKFRTNRVSILAAGSKFVLNCSLYQVDDNNHADPVSCNGETSSECDINRLQILHCTSSDRSACKVKDTKILSNSVISLIQYNVSVLDTGTYFCQYNKRDATEDNTYIRIGDYPIGPLNINCMSLNLEDLICTWKKSTEDKNNPLPVRYRSFLRSSPMYNEFDCPNPIKFSDDQKYRDDQGCSITNLGKTNEGHTFMASTQYTLCINAFNKVGSQVVEFNISYVEIAPRSVPVIGGFAVVDGHINVYIRSLAKWEKHSENASYLVTVTAGSTIKYEVSWNTTTIENITSFSESGFLLELRTKNNIGYSNNTGHLVVPPYRSDRLVPRNVIVEGTGKVFIVSWDTVTSNMKEILVYRCVGNWSKCQSDLDWMSVLPNKTETTVTTDRTADWIFAVSFIYNDGYTTEMVFSHCYFPSIDKAPSGVAAFSVIPGETQLLVKPGEFCSKKYPSKPEQYIVYYKQTAGDIKSCDQSFLTKTQRALMGKGEITLDNLAPGGHYSVCLSVMSGGGQSVLSEPQKVQTLSKENNSSITVIIVLVISVCIGAVLILFVVRKMLKKYRVGGPKIDLPTVNTKLVYTRVSVKEDSDVNEVSFSL